MEIIHSVIRFETTLTNSRLSEITSNSKVRAGCYRNKYALDTNSPKV